VRVALAREWLVPMAGATGVHLVAALVLTLGFVQTLPDSPRPVRIIEADLIDLKFLEAEAARQRAVAQAEARVREQTAAAEAARELTAARASAAAEADARRMREVQAKAVADAAAAETKRQREAEAKAKRDAAAQKARERDLRAQLAAEERRRSAERSGLLEQYKAAVQQKVVRNWIRPAAAQAGLECRVRVQQLPTGDVIGVAVLACNGDETVQRSIENAVLRASPLPLPSDRALFERELEFIFRPTR